MLQHHHSGGRLGVGDGCRNIRWLCVLTFTMVFTQICQCLPRSICQCPAFPSAPHTSSPLFGPLKKQWWNSHSHPSNISNISQQNEQNVKNNGSNSRRQQHRNERSFQYHFNENRRHHHKQEKKFLNFNTQNESHTAHSRAAETEILATFYCGNNLNELSRLSSLSNVSCFSNGLYLCEQRQRIAVLIGVDCGAQPHSFSHNRGAHPTTVFVRTSKTVTSPPSLTPTTTRIGRSKPRSETSLTGEATSGQRNRRVAPLPSASPSPTTFIAGGRTRPRRRQANLDCNQSRTTRDSCLRGMRCTCQHLKYHTDTDYCGDHLKGSDCRPEVVYRCRRFGPALPLRLCPFGCHSSGQCRTAGQPQEVTTVASLDNVTTTHVSSPETDAISSVISSPADAHWHEYETVTFTPVVRNTVIDP